MTKSRTALPGQRQQFDRQTEQRALASEPVVPLRLSLSQLTTLRWSVQEEAAAAAAAGYQSLSLWRTKVADFGLQKTAHVLEEHGLGVSALSWAGGFTGSHGFTYEEALRDARDALRQAAILKAETLVIVGGARAGHTSRHARRLVRDGILSLADQAADLKIRLGLLPMHPALAARWTFLQSTYDTLEFIHDVNHPSVGFVFDTYHLWQESGLIARIPELAPLVTLVQLGDWSRPPQHEYDRCLPGEGLIPLDEIVPTFLRAGYQGHYDIHVWSDTLWKRGDAAFVSRCAAFVQNLRRGASNAALPA